MSHPFYRSLFRNTLFAAVLIVLAGGGMGGSLHAWRVARGDVNLRTISLSLAVVGGVVAAALLALAMRALDKPLQLQNSPWYIRLPLKLNKRILLLVQVAAAGLAVASAYFLAFHFAIPSV